jgi:3-hydroxyisobutyrate dehydrogenase
MPQHTKKIGYVGLGVMGGRMARRLVDAGFPTMVFDINPDSVATLRSAGAEVAASPRELAQTVDTLMFSLPTPDHVHAVLTDQETGALTEVNRTFDIVDFSTIGPTSAAEFAGLAADKGIAMLDTPVGGGWMEARDGKLVIMAGGDEAALERNRDVLDVIGRSLFHFGPAGTGQAAKVALNMSQSVMTAGAAEAVRLLKATDVNLDVFLDTLKSLDANPWFQRPLQHYLDDDFSPGFRIDLMLKDIRLALATAQEQGLTLRVSELAKEIYADAGAAGLGGLHISGVVKLEK